MLATVSSATPSDGAQACRSRRFHGTGSDRDPRCPTRCPPRNDLQFLGMAKSPPCTARTAMTASTSARYLAPRRLERRRQGLATNSTRWHAEGPAVVGRFAERMSRKKNLHTLDFWATGPTTPPAGRRTRRRCRLTPWPESGTLWVLPDSPSLDANDSFVKT